jgi:hypothetical protein
MSQHLIARSASEEIKNEQIDAENKPLFCTQKNFDQAIEVTIKLIDRLDRYDRVFAEDE